jgi:tetratricopeptide (TPR) repeat protein
MQDFTGDVRLGLARARWKIARNLPMEDGERLNAADRLAQSLQVCLGDHSGALPLFEEVLAVSRRVDGNEDVNTLISMSNLASLHQKMGNHHLALPLFEEALLAQQRKRNGKEAQDTLLTLNNLAMLHLRTERFSLALPLAEKALAGRRRTLGNDHADTLESIHNLGLLRWHMAHGEYVSFTNAAAHQGNCDVTELEKAKELLADALKGRRRVFGEAYYLTQESIRALKHANQKLEEIRTCTNSSESSSASASKTPLVKKRRLEETKKENEEA